MNANGEICLPDAAARLRALIKCYGFTPDAQAIVGGIVSLYEGMDQPTEGDHEAYQEALITQLMLYRHLPPRTLAETFIQLRCIRQTWRRIRFSFDAGSARYRRARRALWAIFIPL